MSGAPFGNEIEWRKSVKADLEEEMCRLVDLKLKNGAIVRIAENKENRIKKYLSIFPQLKSIDQVILFGSVITEHCTEQSDVDLCFLYTNKQQYREDMAELYFEIMPESTADDAMCAESAWFKNTNALTGAMKAAANEGILIYDRKW